MCDLLVTAIKSAREQPHVLTAYSRRRAYRLRIRNLDEWYDLETLLAGLIETADPFKLLWTQRRFEAKKVQQ